MAKYTYKNLIQGVTFDEAKKYVLGLAQSAGIPVTSFQSGDIGYTQLLIAAELLSQFADSVVETSKQIYRSVATGDYLDMIVENHYQESRHAATNSVIDGCWYCHNAYPEIKDIGEILISIDGVDYYNNASITIPNNGYLTVEFISKDTGASTRVSTSTKPIFYTPISGVQFIPFETNIYSLNVSEGQDAETDYNLDLRCKNKWASLSFNTPADAYKYYVLNSSYQVNGHNISEITRIQVDQSKAQASGRMNIACATNVGARYVGDSTTMEPTSSAIVAANAIVQEKRGIGSWVTLINVPYIDTNVKVTCTYDTSLNKESVATRKINLLGYVSGYVGNLEIGETIIVSELIRIVKDGIIGLKDITFEVYDTNLNEYVPLENITLLVNLKRYAGLLTLDYNYLEV